MSFNLTTDDFSQGGAIPRRFTCDGDDISPELAWTDAPRGTRTFALIVDDPDAPRGVFTHWVLFNLPAASNGLHAKMPSSEQLPDGALQGRNDFGKIGYGGPCPPPGPGHHYHFTLYALDSVLNLGPKATKEQVLNAMQGHVLGRAEVTGTYKRAG